MVTNVSAGSRKSATIYQRQPTRQIINLRRRARIAPLPPINPETINTADRGAKLKMRKGRVRGTDCVASQTASVMKPPPHDKIKVRMKKAIMGYRLVREVILFIVKSPFVSQFFPNVVFIAVGMF
jgi:hypothetical protein